MTREEAKELFKKASDVAVNYLDHVEIVVSLHSIDIVLNEIFNKHEAQLKAKEEEIERLKIQLTGWSMLLDEPQDIKARKIVAMLFWEWRKKERRFVEEWNRNNMSIACAEFCVMSNNAEVAFGKAYAMLKDKHD